MIVVQCHFSHFRKLLFFSVTSYPGEIAYFNSLNRELSTGVLLLKLYKNRNVDPSKEPMLHRKAQSSKIFLSFQAKT